MAKSYEDFVDTQNEKAQTAKKSITVAAEIDGDIYSTVYEANKGFIVTILEDKTSKVLRNCNPVDVINSIINLFSSLDYEEQTMAILGLMDCNKKSKKEPNKS